MKAQQLLSSTVHDPEALKVVFEAFDSAWADVKGNYAPGEHEEARHRLASMMLSFVSEGPAGAEELKIRTLAALRGKL